MENLIKGSTSITVSEQGDACALRSSDGAKEANAKVMDTASKMREVANNLDGKPVRRG